MCQGRLQVISRWNYVYFCDGFSSISQDWSIRLSSRLVWYQILSVCFFGLQRSHPENPYEKDLDVSRSVHLIEIWQISCLEDVRQAQMDLSGPRGPRWRAMSSFYMARRTGFREQYYTGTRRYKCVREDWRQYQCETICSFAMVVRPYLWINVFVWADFFCGIRYYQFASLDCSGAIQKIPYEKD